MRAWSSILAISPSVLMPVAVPVLGSAAGLSGGAATVHGLASLGGGSVAAGGMGMAGGVGLLSATGVGAGAAAAALHGGRALTATELWGAALEAELMRLRVAVQLDLIYGETTSRPPVDVLDALREQAQVLRATLTEETGLNELKSSRVQQARSAVDLVCETIRWVERELRGRL